MTDNKSLGLISIVIPVFNSEKYIQEALDSIYEQSYRNYEIIVVDDGSKDKSIDLLKKYKNIKLISQKNSGAYKARNVGIDAAKGEYIAFLDADDIWDKEKLLKQIQIFTANPNISVIGTAMNTFDKYGLENKKYQKKNIIYDTPFCPYSYLLVQGNPFCTSSMVVRKDALKQVGNFPDERTLSLDYDLWIRLAAEDNLFYVISEGLTNYRILASSLLHGSLKKEYGAQFKILELNRNRYSLDSYNKRKSKIYYEWADSAFYKGSLSGIFIISKAIWNNPFSISNYKLFFKGILLSLKKKLTK